jgi:hypothetical protein
MVPIGISLLLPRKYNSHLNMWIVAIPYNLTFLLQIPVLSCWKLLNSIKALAIFALFPNFMLDIAEVAADITILGI